MTTTILQAEKLLNIGKIIIGGLVAIIILTGTVSITGTNFMNNTKHGLDSLATGQNKLNIKVDIMSSKEAEYHEHDVIFQQSTEDRLKALETKPATVIKLFHPHPGYITQTR